MAKTSRSVPHCQQKGIKLNSEKIQFRQKQLSNMGHIISSEGLWADPGGVRHEIRPIEMRYFSVVFALENITFGR